MDAAVVVYHYPCLDGIFAALVASLSLEKDGRRIRYVAASTVNPPSVARLHLRSREIVYLLDFAPISFVLEIAALCKRVVVVDHHKTAMDDFRRSVLPDNLELHLDGSKCAATLALEYFNPPGLPNSLYEKIRYDLKD